MHCESCGATLGDSARFCSACGKPVRREEGAKVDRLAEALQRALPANFSIIRPLGRGGMGAVYLARDEFLDREVAIKTLPAELGSDSTLRERFRREARIAAKLHHPNIVPLYTFGEAEDILYYVMGYVRGEPLSQRIQREATIDPDEARKILGEIADALRYASTQSVVHRDLKPENILLEDSTRTAFLADFGIARMSGGSHMTRAGAVLGTPLYMSPEQAVGGEADHRSDLYSLGVIGYRMLTGRFPVSGETFSEMLAQHAARKPQPLVELNPAVPADLSDAIMRCLEKDPNDRWQSAEELRAALVGTTVDRGEETALDVQGAGFYFLLYLWIAALFLPFEIFFWPDIDIGWRLLIELIQCLPLFGILALGAGMANARHEKVPWRSIWPAVFHAPRWYWGWMPRRFRPPGDVWDRLPGPVRLFRTLFTLAILASPILIIAFPIAFLSRSGKTVLMVIVWSVLALHVPAVLAAFGAERKLRKLGVTDPKQISMFLNTSTWVLGRSRNPAIAKILASASAAVSPADSTETKVPKLNSADTPTRKEDSTAVTSESTIVKP